MYTPFIHLDKDTEQELIIFIDTELRNYTAESSGFKNDLSNLQQDYWAQPSQVDITYPFQGAANIIIPLGAIAVEATHARVMTTLFALPDFVATKSVDSTAVDMAEPVQRYLNKELIQSAKIRKPLESAILEIEKYGTGIAKTVYERTVRKGMRKNPQTDELEEFEVVLHDGPKVYATSIGRFMMRYSETDIQTSLWCGEEITLPAHTIQTYEDSGFFYPGTVEKLKNSYVYGDMGSIVTDRKFLNEQQELENRKPVLAPQYDICEIYLSWNVDRNQFGNKREIVFHYHPLTRTILSVRDNWNEDLRRPYRAAVYFPVEHRWTGIGICQQLKNFQEEITTQHRQRLDNASIANMRGLKVHRLSGIAVNEPIFPGKKLYVDNMDDVQSFQLGEIYPSSFNNEQATLIYSQQRSGVNEVTLGMPQVGTPGTATSDLARIQEGNKKYDHTYSNIKIFADEVILDATCLIKQFGSKTLEFYDQNKEGKLVRKFFDLPFDVIKEQIFLQVSSAGQKNNKLLDRQNWQMIAQLYQQYLTGMFQLLQTTGLAPQLGSILGQRGLLGATESMRQILETFDIPNIDRIIPINEIRDLLNQQPGGDLSNVGLNGIPTNGGTGGTPAASPQAGIPTFTPGTPTSPS